MILLFIFVCFSILFSLFCIKETAYLDFRLKKLESVKTKGKKRVNKK
jgi:Mg2+/Co2+ transporter CorB